MIVYSGGIGALTWSASDSRSCLPIAQQCNRVLDAPLHGAVSMTTGYTGDIAVFSCGTGFVLEGYSSTTCLENAQWSNTHPQCKGSFLLLGFELHHQTSAATGCGELDVPKHSRIQQVVDRAVRLACNDGYTMSGDGMVACQDNGTWSSAMPTCNGMMGQQS